MFSLFKKLWASYCQLCREAGIEQGSCRGCVPIPTKHPEKDTTDRQ